MAGERIDTVETDVVAVLDQGALGSGVADRSVRQHEVHRVLVVQDQESILPADDRVLHRILDASRRGSTTTNSALGSAASA